MPAGDDIRIQPGRAFEIAGTLCTLGFILTDAEGVLFALTAGHCVQDAPRDVKARMRDGTPLGIVYFHETNDTADWALLRIDSASYRFVSPSVQYWGGPVGLPAKGSIKLDDYVCHYGHGDVFDKTSTGKTNTRPRCGRYWGSSDHGDHNEWHVVRSLTYAGDSGSPVIDYANGHALGLLSRASGDVAEGETVCGILGQLAHRGYTLTLATAPYDPPAIEPYPPSVLPPLDPVFPGFDQTYQACGPV